MDDKKILKTLKRHKNNFRVTQQKLRISTAKLKEVMDRHNIPFRGMVPPSLETILHILEINDLDRTKTAAYFGVSTATFWLWILGETLPKRAPVNRKWTLQFLIDVVMECRGDFRLVTEKYGVPQHILYDRLEQVPCTGIKRNVYIGSMWDRYLLNNKDEFAFNELISFYKKWVTNVAIDLHARLNKTIDVDDLTQEGMMGLMEAISRYNPAKAPYFVGYANRRVRGQMTDYIREMDYVPRLSRTRQKERLKAEENLGTSDQETIRQHLGWTDTEYTDSIIKSQGSISHVFYDNTIEADSEGVQIQDALTKEEENPFETDRRREEIMRGLSSQEKAIICGYYWEDKTMKEIGVSLGISESRISQLHSDLIIRLREKDPDRILNALCA